MADEQRTVGTQSFSGASGPSEPAKTVYDGDTPTKYNASNDLVLQAIRPPELPPFGGPEKVHYPPCINPSCKSYGKSHPNCRCYAGPGGTSLESSTFAEGGEVSHFCSANNMHSPECEHYEHPQETIDGAVLHHGLLHLLTKTGKTKSEDPMRAMSDHKDASIRGQKVHSTHVENVFEKSHRAKPESKSTMALKKHLEELQEKPESMLDIGGDLNPEHSAQLGALAGKAVTYFQSIKPKQQKNAILDQDQPVDKLAEAKYNRQLELAEHPSAIMNHIKDGTLRPSDIETISTLYPKLYESIKSKVNDSIINALTNKKDIPYRQTVSLSLLLGQPLDTTLNPQSMQAIIQSQAMQQAKNQQQKQPKKASATELKQINKVDEMAATRLQHREMDRK